MTYWFAITATGSNIISLCSEMFVDQILRRSSPDKFRFDDLYERLLAATPPYHRRRTKSFFQQYLYQLEIVRQDTFDKIPTLRGSD